MKKLFISCPMRGRTEDSIKSSMERMHKIAEAYFDQELEVIQSYIPDTAPTTGNRRVWYLGESIKMMAEADYFIGIQYEDAFAGCNIEVSVARGYNIPYTLVDLCMMPDAVEVAREFWEKVAQ